MSLLLRCLLFCLPLLLPPLGAAAQQAQTGLPIIALTIGKHKLQAEVAATPGTRERGLMFRYDLGEDQGMLFVFTEARRHSFWMKNTPLPLSIAFIDPKGVIINIRDMAPFTTDSHAADGDALYALEVNRGWFAQRGIRAGDRVLGLERAPKAR